MVSSSNKEYWIQKKADVAYLEAQMNMKKPGDPAYQAYDRQRLQILDEAEEAGVWFPDL